MVKIKITIITVSLI